MEQMRNARGLLDATNTPQMVYEDFQPSSDWTHDSICHVLLVDLPGFKREELKVRVDNTKKVTVGGERQVSDNKYSRFNQVYNMPEDSDIDSITGRFDEGVLFIIIPKKKTEGLQAPKTEIQRPNEIEEEKKEEKSGKEDGDKHKHEKEDEKRVPKSGKDSHEKKEEKHIPKKDDRESQEKKDDMNKEEPKKDNEDKHGDRSYIHDEKKEESKTNDIREGLAVQKVKMEEDWRKLIERVKNNEDLEILKKSTLEKIRNNKTVIITAIVAFSIGLYISGKFQSGGQ